MRGAVEIVIFEQDTNLFRASVVDYCSLSATGPNPEQALDNLVSQLRPRLRAILKQMQVREETFAQTQSF